MKKKGSINTGTDLDHSNYCFECNSSVFEQGLERFISYFKSPKFNSIYLDKILQVFIKFYFKKITESLFKGNPFRI